MSLHLAPLLTDGPQVVLKEGAQITDCTDLSQLPVPMIGHVTSSYLSPTLGRSIAMAVVKGGHQRAGETVQVALSNGTTVRATVGSTVFYDPQSERQNA